MALRGCLACVKYIVFFLNFIIWLSGLIILGAAIYLRMDRFSNYVIVTSLTPHATSYHVICYIFMAVGGAMTFVGFLGCCSAFHESRAMLGSFFACLMLMLILQLGTGVLAFLYRSEVHTDIPEKMKTYMQTVYGRDPYTDEPVDYLQRMLHCCGSYEPQDWRHSEWYNSTSEQRQISLPQSCCKGNTAQSWGPTGLQGSCQTASSDWSNSATIWTDGCANIIENNLRFRVFIASIIFLALTTEQVISLCLSITLCCAMRREAAGGYKS